MKLKTSFILVFLLTSVLVFAQSQTGTNAVENSSRVIIQNGIGFGSVLAIVLSWDRNKSILFAILHGIFSWLYVIYYAITRK